eukprot:9174125-Alexandrium_andersonii.AAC.1
MGAPRFGVCVRGWPSRGQGAFARPHPGGRGVDSVDERPRHMARLVARRSARQRKKDSLPLLRGCRAH